MNRKQVFLLFLFCLLIFSFYFMRPDLEGADSYYFAANLTVEEFVLVKLLLLAGFFVSVASISLIGELFHEQEGWKAGVYAAGLAPALLWEFVKFENDQLALVLLFVSLAALYLWKFKKSYDGVVVAGLGWVTAFIVWKGSLFYLGAFALISFVFAPIAAIGGVVYFSEALVHLDPFVVPAYENLPIVGLAWLFLLLAGIYGIRKDTLMPTLFLLIVLLLNAKFTVLVVPFLAIGMVRFLEGKPRFFKDYFLYAAIVLGFVWGGLVLGLPPTQDDWNAIDYGYEKSVELGVDFKPYWDYGYWARWKGHDVPYAGGEQPVDFDNSIVITKKDIECEFLEEFGMVKVYHC